MSKKYKFDITYVYGNGRKIKLESKNPQGKEFFYGYPYFLKNNYKLNILETNNAGDLNNSKLTKIFLSILEKYLSKLTKLTFYLKSLITKQVLIDIYNSKNIITSNHGIGMTLFIYIKFFKLFKKINYVVIISGLFAMKKTNILSNILRKFVLSMFLSTVDKLIFTNRSEYEFATKNFIKFNDKFVCIPFCLDLEFWKPSQDIEILEKKGILFIGNNGHRDFNLVINIAEKLPNIEFTFITKIIKDEDIKSNNVNNILGDWNANYLSDEEIKDFYERARIVILPINNTLVSSGQSAGLQSASVGTPVLTSKTVGFWDYENYKDRENIIFLENNNLDLWVSKIKEIYEDIDLLSKISVNSKKLVVQEYALEIFNKELEKCLILK
tara:strand:+ start:2329 stop:3477 length:1149 start_codon:yes stop_codon:yes gene_type:complete